jgi:O-acetyl-ADP-ribose deacetylase (regulator of RNase III)
LITPQSLNAELSDRVSQILERCLAKSPRDRFQSFAEVVAHLDEASSSADLWDDNRDTALRPFLDRYGARREDYLSSRFEEDCYEFADGRVLKIVKGDIVEQRVDAIVSSDDSQLSMSGGVSCCILIAAGPLLRDEVQAFAPARPGRVVVTRAGQLPARFVFHGITLGIHKDNVLLPSRDIIAEILKNCFYHADTLYVKSMAIPQIGGGVGGFPKATGLDLMFRFVARTLVHNLTGVREVRIVLLGDHTGARKWWAAMAKRPYPGLSPSQQAAMAKLAQVAESIEKTAPDET